jgi:hypothetical protein
MVMSGSADVCSMLCCAEQWTASTVHLVILAEIPVCKGSCSAPACPSCQHLSHLSHLSTSLCCAASCRTIVSVVRDSLTAGRFAQNPCLECDDLCADAAFIVA